MSMWIDWKSFVLGCFVGGSIMGLSVLLALAA